MFVCLYICILMLYNMNYIACLLNLVKPIKYPPSLILVLTQNLPEILMHPAFDPMCTQTQGHELVITQPHIVLVEGIIERLIQILKV